MYTFEPDVWSTALLDKLELQNLEAIRTNYPTRVDISEVKKALYYCKKYHAGQKRDSGEPYYSHPITVANYVTSQKFSTDIVITAILHDVIEDSEVTVDMVCDWFGPVIANNVEGLTRIKPCGRKMTTIENINDMFLRKLYDALHVKLFDRVHNLETIKAKSPEKQKKIIEETFDFFIVCAMHVKNNEIEKMFYNLCCEVLSNKEFPYEFLKFRNHEFNNLPSLESGYIDQIFSQVFQNTTLLIKNRK